jgi:Family of unknown function (DUF6529)
MLGVLNAGHDRLALGHNGADAFRGPLEPPREHGVRTNEATMIEDRGRSTSKPRNWTRFAALLAVFALSFVTIRLLAGRSAGGYPTPPFFHLFFSDTIHMKAWLATGAIVLALFQLLSATRLFELFHCAPAEHFWGRMHRLSGYLAILLTLPVAYHCIFLLGFETTSPRVAIHSILGSAFYGAFLVKVILVRSRGFPGWALPVAGGLVFAILAGLWVTSSLYLFSSSPIIP